MATRRRRGGPVPVGGAAPIVPGAARQAGARAAPARSYIWKSARARVGRDLVGVRCVPIAVSPN